MSTKLKRIAFVLVSLLFPVLFGSLISSNPKVVAAALLFVLVMVLIIALWNISGLLFNDNE